MKRKIRKSSIILLIGSFIGLAAFLYPTVSDYWNSMHTTKAVSAMVNAAAEIDEEDYKEIWDAAIAYNEKLRQRENYFETDEMLLEEYEQCLNISGDGAIGFIEIPKIDVTLPIYHGTSNEVLSMACGHLDWSSLPTGGEGTHCVLSGHRGLPTAKLFTDLDDLREGDQFMLTVLNEVLTYEVDRILTVKPDDIGTLSIRKGRDLCTLVTCTPYGINTERLLVTGHRVASVYENEVHIIQEAVVIDPLIVAPVVALPLLIGLLLVVMLKKPKKKIKSPVQ